MRLTPARLYLISAILLFILTVVLLPTNGYIWANLTLPLSVGCLIAATAAFVTGRFSNANSLVSMVGFVGLIVGVGIGFVLLFSRGGFFI